MPLDVQIEIEASTPLRFDDGDPVRAASAVVAYGDGWLVVQDDATHGAWVRPLTTTRVRLLPAVEGLEVFSSEAGTKHLKPDLEAACAVTVDGTPAVLLLGSGSTAARTRCCLLAGGRAVAADLPELYAEVAAALELPPGTLNLEGACVVGDRLRWFARGGAGTPSASVDVALPDLLALVAGSGGRPALSDVRRYDLGAPGGVDLQITDAVTLADGRVLVCAAAEDTPDPVADGPVGAAALALLDGERVLVVDDLPPLFGEVQKVEGLALRAEDGSDVRLVSVVDADDAAAASMRLDLRVRLG